MPYIHTYGWPVGSIVTPTTETAQHHRHMYPVGRRFKIIPPADDLGNVQQVEDLTTGSLWNGCDGRWSLVTLPFPAELFPDGSRIRLVSYPFDDFQPSNRVYHYGEVGTLATISGRRVLLDDGTLWGGDKGIWELANKEEAAPTVTEFVPGNLYIITSNRNSHQFEIGQVVRAGHRVSSSSKSCQCEDLEGANRWWVLPGDCKPFEGVYKPTYTYLRIRDAAATTRTFTSEYVIPVYRDASAYKVFDNLGSSLWVYLDELPTPVFEVVKLEEPVFPDQLAKWGTDWDRYRRYLRDYSWDRVAEWLQDMLHDQLGVSANFYEIFAHYDPHNSRKVRGQVAVWQSAEKRDRDISTAMKPGRAFKLMFPQLTDAQLERLVDAYRIKFPVTEYKLNISEDAAAFKLAYSGTQEPMQNPYTTSSRKSLANSCMRYKFDNLPHHPAEAYASGEFKIFYTTGPRGYIGSRCVVWYGHKSGRPVAGPIYGVCEHSIDTIAEALEKESAFFYGEESWKGAKMQKIRHVYDGVIAPYIDGCCQYLKDEGTHLIVSDRGDYDASTYNGVLGGHDYHCYQCGCGMHEDDMHYSESTEEYYCESCFSDSHTRCYHYDNYYHNDDINTAYMMRRGQRYEIQVSTRAIDNAYYIYCESDGEYWSEDDVVLDHNDDYLDPITAERDYFLCQWTDKYWPNDQRCELTCGTVVCRQEIEADEGYFLNSDGKYEQNKEEEAA